MSSPSVKFSKHYTFVDFGSGCLELKMSNLDCEQKKTGTKGFPTPNGQWCSYQKCITLTVTSRENNC